VHEDCKTIVGFATDMSQRLSYRTVGGIPVQTLKAYYDRVIACCGIVEEVMKKWRFVIFLSTRQN